jgi:leucyl-tRNA synthetase
VTEDIESFGFNTAISALMIYSNELPKSPSKADAQAFLTLLHPFAPHLTEEIWASHSSTPLAASPWPSYEERFLKDANVEYAVQVNGKVRDTFKIAADASQDQAAEAALALDKVKAAIGAQTVIKKIVVPKKLVNLVVK